MKRCPITYEVIDKGKYSSKGLKKLSKSLKDLNDFPFSAKEQIQLARQFADKLSIQGVQPKLSVKVDIKNEIFRVVEQQGQYIVKPPNDLYEQLPENEDVTMRMAESIGIAIPFHGLFYNKDGSLSYFIKRFDRQGKLKVGVEDFSQLLEYSRDTKYESSMEQVISVIDKHCTFPVIEKLKLFRVVLFSYLVGNEDMHLKNFSLIRRDPLIELSPAYDLLNTSIAIGKYKEEIALPIRGKKSNLKREDIFDYFGVERLKIPKVSLEEEYKNIEKALPSWFNLLDISFLSEQMRNQYKEMLDVRWKRILLLR